MASQKQPVRVAACVTLFRPDESVTKLLNALRETFSDLILIDNCAGAHVVQPGDVLVEKPSGNVGVSSALNLGLQAAWDRGYDWVAYFDQDSWPNYDAAQLIARLEQAGDNTAIVSAQYVDRATGRAGYQGHRLEGYPLAPISSGSAFQTSAWHSIGGFEVRLPVDLVDTEYALRAQGSGFEVEIETGLEIDHSVGAKKDFRILGRTFILAGHVPWRLYTKLDASVLVVPRYLRRFPKWAIRHVAERTQEVLVDLVLGSQRLRTTRMLSRWVLRRTPPEIALIRQNSKHLPQPMGD